MRKIENLILGAGIAGLGTAHRLEECGSEYLVIEKDSNAGGLCSGFRIDGFDFDYFIHMSFTTIPEVRELFDKTTYYRHLPNPCNYYHGIWIKHPAINNLFPLSEDEKDKILESIKERGNYRNSYEDNYESWLRYQYGDYFTEHFSLAYTRKYWTEEAHNMETQWIGNRVYQPTIKEVIDGMKTEETPMTYYAKEMRYPLEGGFKTFLNTFVNTENISLNETVVEIDPVKKIVKTNKRQYIYERLYSSIPVTELGMIKIDDEKKRDDFHTAISKLHWTGAYLISLGIKGDNPRSDLWDYIYDEEILVARYYSPSLMSPHSAPEGYYSVQAEIYTKNGGKINCSDRELLDRAIQQMDMMNVIDKEDIVVKDIRFRKYCNIIFDHCTYKNRDIIMQCLHKNGINPIGRFGKWEYYWSDQSFMSGYNAVDS